MKLNTIFLIFFTLSTPTLALGDNPRVRIPSSESAQERNLDRKKPIISPTNPDGWRFGQKDVQVEATDTTSPTFSLSAILSGPTYGPNLITNPSLEAGGTNGNPQGWNRGGYGTSTRVFTYLATSTSGSRAIRLSVTNYISGDAKWYPNDVPVTGGRQYEFSDIYTSTTQSIVTIRYKLSNNSYIYQDIVTLSSTGTLQTVAQQFTAPTDAVSATVFHLLKSNGTLITDDYIFREVIPPPPPNNLNLVPNGDFETVGINGNPQGWNKGGYGTNTSAFAYPTTSLSGRGTGLSISNYVSGDRKWFFNTINIPAGLYKYSDDYLSTTQSYVTAQFENLDGSFAYSDLAILPSSNGVWQTMSVDFVMPTSAIGIKVFHLIKSNGNLALDNVSVTMSSDGEGIFSTGAVTFRFDDGLNSQYATATPILDKAQFKGTYYITTRQTREYGFIGYISVADIQSLRSRGHEIGSHTRNHAHLSSLSTANQQVEIQGSKDDLDAMSVGPILTFSYPFGEYNATTTQIVRNAGYTSALATITGYVSPTSDHYQLEYQEPLRTTSLSTMQGWVDTAIASRRWLIIAFHDVDTSGNFYAVTPTNFEALVSYIKLKGIPVVTVSEGLSQMP